MRWNSLCSRSWNSMVKGQNRALDTSSLFVWIKSEEMINIQKFVHQAFKTKRATKDSSNEWDERFWRIVVNECIIVVFLSVVLKSLTLSEQCTFTVVSNDVTISSRFEGDQSFLFYWKHNLNDSSSFVIDYSSINCT